MTDSESWKERRNQVARYRVMAQETTDPLAARLLQDIILDLEALTKSGSLSRAGAHRFSWRGVLRTCTPKLAELRLWESEPGLVQATIGVIFVCPKCTSLYVAVQERRREKWPGALTAPIAGRWSKRGRAFMIVRIGG
jgi:hypothetical protein